MKVIKKMSQSVDDERYESVQLFFVANMASVNSVKTNNRRINAMKALNPNEMFVKTNIFRNT